LQWRDNSTNEEGFRIDRKTGSATTFITIDSVGSNVIQYTDTILSPNTTYYYRLCAFNVKGYSNYSNEGMATTMSAAGIWTVQTSGTTQHLYGIWGTSATNVFAVGYNGTILHYNGTSWNAMNSGTTLSLYGIYGFSPTDVFIAGDDVAILRYNGSAWNKMTTSHPNFLPNFNALWGATNADVWAVGTGYLRMRYNGSTWSGSTNIISNNLRGVWGSSSTNVYTVGDFGTVYRYNGTSWSADIDVTGINDLWLDFRDIWGVSANEIFLVGDYDPNGTGDGDNSGAVLKYTGTQWSFFWKDSIPELRGIWGSSANDFFVVGLKGSIAHFDGTKFTKMNSGTTQNLLRVWGTATDVFAVGAYGTILHYKK
jgi:hypothetical protein